MERIEPGKYVALTYDLYEVMPDGTEELRHQSDADDPETFVFGVTPGLVPALEKDLPGKTVGDKYDVLAPEAFGPYDVEAIVELEKEIFEVDGKFDEEMVKEGEVLPMMTADGFRVNGKVVGVTDTHVRLDFNHPLAGKTVRFKGEVKEVRDAKPEEIQPVGGCCGGGCCGDDHDHGCGDGCCH